MTALVLGIAGVYLYRFYDLASILEYQMDNYGRSQILRRQINSLTIGTAIIGGVLVPAIFSSVVFLVLNAHREQNALRKSAKVGLILAICILLIVFLPYLPSLLYR